MLLQAAQSATDTGIHLTLGTATVALIAKEVWYAMRKNGNGNEVLRELRKQTDILQDLAKDIAVVLDRTKK